MPPRRRNASATSVVIIGVVLALASVAAGAPSDLDPQFGTAGKLTVGSGNITGLAVLPDDSIIVTIASFTQSPSYALVRITPDGALDPSFGAGGIFAGDGTAGAPAIGPGGTILVTTNAADPSHGAIMVRRHLADGSIDSSFGNGGTASAPVPPAAPEQLDGAGGVAVYDDGGVLAAGCGCSVGNDVFKLVRFTANGIVDDAFGLHGIVQTQFAVGAELDDMSSLALQPDQKAVAAGSTLPLGAGSPGRFALARYETDGRLDQSFGAGGKVTVAIEPGSRAFSTGVALGPEGKIVVSGMSGSNFAVVRLLPDGRLDPSFGNGGTITTAVSNGYANALAVQPDGTSIVAGRAALGDDVAITVARYRDEGSLDSAFGVAGILHLVIGSEFIGRRYDSAAAVALQSSGRIIVGVDSAGTGAVLLGLVGGPPGPPVTTTTTLPRIPGSTTTTLASCDLNTTTTLAGPVCDPNLAGKGFSQLLHGVDRNLERLQRKAMHRARRLGASGSCRTRLDEVFTRARESLSLDR